MSFNSEKVMEFDTKHIHLMHIYMDYLQFDVSMLTTSWVIPTVSHRKFVEIFYLQQNNMPAEDLHLGRILIDYE